MAANAKTDAAPGLMEEERLIQALVGRGLITAEEAQTCRKDRSDGETGAKGLLQRLVRDGHLTLAQAKRTLKNLEAAVHEQIPGFQLLEKLGQGSMGAVYKARQLSMDRLVAIKILQPKHARDPGYLQQFIREAHLAAKLSSNNVVQAIDAGSVGALHYFVMEYVEGKTIKDELEAGKVYPETEAVEIVLQVAQALENAHRRRLIHRDVKPGNIILTKEGGVKLADLGLARLVEDSELDKAEKGLTIGTPYYIAPELIKGKTDADIRADIYSLGATLYHMVTGRPPFPGAKVKEVLQAHLHKELTPPDHINTRLSAGLGEVVEYMMAKDREQRYQTPADVILDLECLFRGEPPRLARQRSHLSALKNLAQGDAETASEPEIDSERSPRYSPAKNTSPQWTVILAILLAISLLANLLLLATR